MDFPNHGSGLLLVLVKGTNSKLGTSRTIELEYGEWVLCVLMDGNRSLKFIFFFSFLNGKYSPNVRFTRGSSFLLFVSVPIL
jgi:hypothetical protein